ncbi:MAG: hypothetical protein KC609_21125 [Myxococcales bacterium]|nr:hypothetical protein [Myxococcales bacterium]
MPHYQRLLPVLTVACLLALALPSRATEPTPEQLANVRSEIKRLERMIHDLRPKVDSSMERVRFETLKTYPFTAPIFVAVGHKPLAVFLAKALEKARGQGTLSVGATSFRYSWQLDGFRTATDDGKLQFTANYTVNLIGFKRCRGQFDDKLRWESGAVLPTSLRASCQTSKGLIGVYIDPEALKVQIPFSVPDEFRLADGQSLRISGSLYLQALAVGLVMRGSNIRIRK